jgi:hypothetical protein
MRYIDAFNHFFPKQVWERMLDISGRASTSVNGCGTSLPSSI